MTSVIRRREQDDSGEYSDVSQEDLHSENEAPAPQSDYSSRGSEDSDLSDQENSGSQEVEKRVDDDEDRSNPQYIPKRGTFYEHDDRIVTGGEVAKTIVTEGGEPVEKKEGGGGSEPPPERRRAPRKSDICDKWSHDKFNANEQMPKSREELVSVYGYDIRNEAGPPHARRNRRYGRGPNKYTRTWEDEEAYKRQVTAATNNNHKKPPNPDEFPELDKSARRMGKKGRQPRSRSQPNDSNESLENGTTQLRRNASIKSPKPTVNKQNLVSKNTNAKSGVIPMGKNKVKPVANDKLPAIENLSINSSVNNVSAQSQRKMTTGPVAQQRPVPTPQITPSQVKKTSPMLVPGQQKTNGRVPPAPAQGPPSKLPAQTSSGAPPSTQAQASEGRPGTKRYSTMRQRPLPETYSPQPQHRFIPTTTQEYQPTPPPVTQHQGSPVAQIHTPPQLVHQVVRANQVSGSPHGPSPPLAPLPPPTLAQTQHTQQQIPQQVRLNMLDQQQLVSHAHGHPMHNIQPPPPHSIGQIPPAQGYAPPAMMPAQYMQGSNNAAVYTGAAMYSQPPPAPYPHPLYPHHNYATASGVTYYSPAEQEQVPRAQRRLSAAIPIVKPTLDRSSNSTEKDNIDRIVENMFVRKPYPNNRSTDAAKEKSQESRSSQEPPSKEPSQPNSLTSSSISNDSRPSVERSESKEISEVKDDKETPTESTRLEESAKTPVEDLEQIVENSIAGDV